MLKIVISPAKKMNITDEFPCNATVRSFLTGQMCFTGF